MGEGPSGVPRGKPSPRGNSTDGSLNPSSGFCSLARWVVEVDSQQTRPPGPRSPGDQVWLGTPAARPQDASKPPQSRALDRDEGGPFSLPWYSVSVRKVIPSSSAPPSPGPHPPQTWEPPEFSLELGPCTRAQPWLLAGAAQMLLEQGSEGASSSSGPRAFAPAVSCPRMMSPGTLHVSAHAPACPALLGYPGLPGILHPLLACYRGTPSWSCLLALSLSLLAAGML